MAESRDQDPGGLPQANHTVEELLTKLLELITRTSTIEKLTDQNVEDNFGIRLEPYKEGVRNYAARLTPEWNVSVELRDDEEDGRRFRLVFYETDPDRHPSMTAICSVDAESFGASLESAGFEREALYGVHGRRNGAGYFRDHLELTVITQGEASDSPEKVAHDCVKSVWIRHRE